MDWISNPIWLGGALTITAVATFDAFFTGLGSWKDVFGFIFIWTSVWAAILSFGIGKWLPTIGAWGRILVLGFFTLTVVIYAIKHGVHGVGAGRLQADLPGLHRPGARPLLQLRRVRAAERGRRRDKGRG